MNVTPTHWIGYRDGAINSNDPAIEMVTRSSDGNLYVKAFDGKAFNVHPKVFACGWDDERIESKLGVYPIRWELDALEIKDLI